MRATARLCAPVRWGIVGTGGIANDFAAALKQVPEASLVAVTTARPDHSVDKASQFATRHGQAGPVVPYASPAELLDTDVEAVYVGALHTAHKSLTLQALEQGKHVLCEKPLGVSAAEVATMRVAAAANGVFLAEAMWTRYFPAMQHVRDVITAGDIGQVRSVHADFGLLVPPTATRMWEPALGGGALLDLGVYPLSFVSWCFGGEAPCAVSTAGHLSSTGVDEWAVLTLDYGNGAHATVSTALTAASPEEWCVNGTRGRIVVHGPGHTPSAVTVTTWGDGDPRGDAVDAVLEFPTSLQPLSSAELASFTYPGSEGLAFQAQAVSTAISDGLKEMPQVPSEESHMLATIVDDALAAIGSEVSGSVAPPVRAVVAGVGVPGASIGWTHSQQLKDDPAASLVGVVEPFFLGGGCSSPDAAAFQDFVATLGGVPTVASFGNLQLSPPTLAIVSGRTSDNPGLALAAVEAGATHVLLEKPGAPAVGDLVALKAALNGLPVVLGFHKHLSPWVRRLMGAKADAAPGAHAMLVSTNTYTVGELAECFERNNEGLLRNMVIHELALLVDKFGITAEQLTHVVIDPDHAPFATHLSTAGQYTDFVQLAVQLHGGDIPVTLCAARCGPASATTGTIIAEDGRTVFTASDADDVVALGEETLGLSPDGVRSYLLAQWTDFATLKSVVIDHIAAGEEGVPEGVATLDTAIEALKLAAAIEEEVFARVPVKALPTQ